MDKVLAIVFGGIAIALSGLFGPSRRKVNQGYSTKSDAIEASTGRNEPTESGKQSAGTAAKQGKEPMPVKNSNLGTRLSKRSSSNRKKTTQAKKVSSIKRKPAKTAAKGHAKRKAS